jgi:hypothetical protein
MDEWSTIHLLNATPEQLSDQQFIASCREPYNAVKPKRAEAIEAALSVEGVLDQVLLDLLVGRDPEKRARMRELVFAAEFCTAFQKWRMLKQLMQTVPTYFSILDSSRSSSLRSDIKDLFDDRNKFAHGDLFVELQNRSMRLRYYEAGTKWVTVDQEFLERLIGRALRSRETHSSTPPMSQTAKSPPACGVTLLLLRLWSGGSRTPSVS